MKKYYNKECHYCSSVQPSNLMEKKTIKVHTGYSIPSLVFTGRVRTRRDYYRKKTVWVCKDCVNEGKGRHWLFNLFN